MTRYIGVFVAAAAVAGQKGGSVSKGRIVHSSDPATLWNNEEIKDDRRY